MIFNNLNKFIVLCISFLTSVACCGGIVKITNEKEIETFRNRFKYHMKDIVEESEIDELKIKVTSIKHNKEASKTSKFIGLCWPKSGVIHLDVSYWNSSEKLEKEALIFHEMAHCTCNGLDHEHEGGTYDYDKGVPKSEEERLASGFYKDGCPKSLMYPKIVSSDCYKFRRKEYIEELKRLCHKKIYDLSL